MISSRAAIRPGDLDGRRVRAIAARDTDVGEPRLFRRKQVKQMKKKLPPAKPPLPKFQSDQEAADYFESHSVAEMWDRLPEVPPAKLPAALARKIRDRRAM